MHRWNRLALVPLLVVALVASALITPSRTMAATPSFKAPTASSTNFNGKVVAKNTPTQYFVATFACSGGSLTGSWTDEVNSSLSFSGTFGPTKTQPAPCALIPTDNNMALSTATSDTSATASAVTSTLFVGPTNNTTTVGTLTLFLTDITRTKTFVSDTNVTCPSTATPPDPCIEVLTTPLGSPVNQAAFSSQVAGSFATLNLH